MMTTASAIPPPRPTGASPRQPLRSGTAMFIAALMLVALLVRLHGLGAPNLWLDEANSWYVAHLSWDTLLRNLRTSPVGPLYFVVLKLWMTVAGESEAALRAPSLIAGVLLVPLVYAIGVRTVSRRAALVGAALTALSPLHLYFAQEARMYMPLALIAAATVFAYVHWRDAIVRPGAGAPRGHGRALVLYAVLAVAMLATNVVSAPLLVALNADAVLVLWRQLPLGGRRGHVLGWVSANAAVAAAAIGFGLLLDPSAAAASQAWRGALGIGGAARALFTYPESAIHGVYYYPDELARAIAGVRGAVNADTVRHLVSLIVAQPLVVAALVVVLARAAPEARHGRARILVLALLIPLIAGAVISVRRQVDLARYFLYASPFLYLLLGIGVARLSRAGGALALACLGAAIVLGTVRTFRVGARDSDYRAVGRDLIAHRTDAGAVFLQPAEMIEPLTYYLHGRLHLPIRAIGGSARLAPALAAAPSGPVWLVLDYRAAAYGYAPDSLGASLGACVIRDKYDDPGGAGVRLVLVAPAATCGNACATCP